MLNEVDLILEDSPVVCHYLLGRPGRVPEASINHYRKQGSPVLLAHKSANIICNGGGSKLSRGLRTRAAKAARLDAPRQPYLEEVGVVLADNHPEGDTFLAANVADLLIQR